MNNINEVKESDIDYDTEDNTDDCHTIYEFLSNDDSDFEFEPSLTVMMATTVT